MSKRKRKPKMEFRYYQMPENGQILALLGDKWIQHYGDNVDYLHFHNYMEIGFCYYGEGSMTLGENQVRFGGRQFTMIPKNFPHTTDSDPGTISRWEYLFINMEDFLREHSGNSRRTEHMIRRIDSRGGVILKEEEYPHLAQKILRLLDIMRTMNEFYEEEADGVLLALLAEAARLNRKPDEKMEEQESGRVTSVVALALDYVSYHYMENIRVEDLARAAHISETHFRRLFSACMRMSPLEYINVVRIQAACEHLQKSDEPVASIAHKCGFSTSSTFNRNFRRVMGVTPVEWRKRPENYERRLLDFDIHTEEGW